MVVGRASGGATIMLSRVMTAPKRVSSRFKTSRVYFDGEEAAPQCLHNGLRIGSLNAGLSQDAIFF
jgi:hypothetical protein